MSEADDRELLESIVRGQIAHAKANGWLIFLPPIVAKHARAAGLWDDAVHVETRPIPLVCEGRMQTKRKRPFKSRGN